MKNFVQPGNVIRVAAPAAVKSGDLVIVGSIVGIAATDALQGADVECAVTGVFELPKAAGAGIDAGDPTYWDASPGDCTATEAGNTLIGVCTETAGSAATKVRVRIGNVDPAALAAQITALTARVTALEGA